MLNLPYHHWDIEPIRPSWSKRPGSPISLYIVFLARAFIVNLPILSQSRAHAGTRV